MVFEGFAKGLSFPITADINGLVKGIGQADLELAKVDKSFARGQKVIEGYGTSMTSLGKSMSLEVTAPIVALGTASVYTAAQFDDSMRQVQATSGATGGEFDALREQARQLGADTAFSATEAAEGMNYLAAAGFDANQVMAAMPGMLSLASAGSVELGAAAEIASSILNGFNLEAEEAGRVADILAQSAASTNAGVTDMGEAMSYVAPVAQATGMSLEETAAAIGIMSNAGIKGSMAGTALRGSLTALMTPTDEAAGIMKRYNLELNTNQKELAAANEKYSDAAEKLEVMDKGLDKAKEKLKEMRAAGTYSKEAIAAQTAEIDRQKKSMAAQKDEMDRLESAAGNLSSKGLVPLNEIVKQFADSGMTTAEIMTIFGDRAGPGMLALIQQGQGGLVDLTTELKNSEGAAKEMSEIMESGPGGAFRTLQGSMEDLAITFGDALIPAILPFMDLLKGLANWLSSLDKNTLTIIVTIAAFAAAMGPVLIVLGMLISSIGTILTIIPAIGVALTFLSANPIVLVIAAVALLVLGLYYLETQFGVISGAIATAIEWSDQFYTAFLVMLGPIGWLLLAIDALGIGWDDVWNGMYETFKFFVNPMIEGINALIGGMNYVNSLGGLNENAFEIPEIPRLASGGIVTQPTIAMIGEAGPEAVIPLSGGKGAGGVPSIEFNNCRFGSDPKETAREVYTYIEQRNRGRGVGT